MVSQADTTLFAWHPIFMTAGFLAFMVEGVLTALDFRAREGMPRVRAIQKHATLQMAASACILLGFTAIVANKVFKGKHHFQTIHAKFGLATVVLAVIAPLGGALSFKQWGFISQLPERWQPWVKAAHRSIGRITLLLSFVTIQLILGH
eukprot:jgi/Astpho2/7354/gw1.00114.143.1_t